MRVALAVTWRRLAIVAFLAAGLFVAWKLTRFESTGWLARDFKLKAAQRLLDGETLYPSDGSGEYPYPPLWAMLVSPLLALPSIVAQYAASILCATAILAALRIVGVRDPFCLAAALISSPVVSAAQIGNASAFVALLLALTYRYNGTPAGIAIALKLYPWPVLIWSGIRRGWRDLLIGMSVARCCGILVPWAIIGFDGIGRYLSVAREITIDLTGPTYALPLGVGVPVTLAALAGDVGATSRPGWIVLVRGPGDARGDARALGVLLHCRARAARHPATATVDRVADPVSRDRDSR